MSAINARPAAWLTGHLLTIAGRAIPFILALLVPLGFMLHLATPAGADAVDVDTKAIVDTPHGGAYAHASADVQVEAEAVGAHVTTEAAGAQVQAEGVGVQVDTGPVDLGLETDAEALPATPPEPGDDAAAAGGSGRPSVEPAAAAVAAPAAATGLAFLPWVRRLLGTAGAMAVGAFSRIHGDELLDHPVRASVLDAVRSRPGATVQDVGHSVGVAWGTAAYHLQRLERARVVVSEREGRDRRFWDIEDPLARTRKRTAPLRGPPQKIAAAVRTQPGLCQKDLCERLGVRPSVASRHLSRLVDAGLVDVRQDGRQRRYRPTEALEALMPMHHGMVTAHDPGLATA